MMFCLTRKLVNFNFRWIFEICRWKKIRKKYFLTNAKFELANVPPLTWIRNFFFPKLDLSWLMYPPEPEKFFYPKLDLSWPMYPPPPQDWKNFKKLNVCFWITFNSWWSAKLSEWWKLTEMQKGPLSHQKWNAHFWIMFNFWWLPEWRKLTERQKWPPRC